jgi:hypothetical protein
MHLTPESDDRLGRTSSPTADTRRRGDEQHLDAHRDDPCDRDDDGADSAEAELIGRLRSGQPVPEDLAATLHDSYREDVFENYENIVALPRSRVPDGVPLHRLDLIEDAIDPERLQALSEGAAPTARECRAWRVAYVERALTNDDADLTSSVNLVPIRDGDGNTAYAIATVCGYSFSGVEVSRHGFALDEDEAIAILRRSFYLSCDPAPAMPVVAAERNEAPTSGERLRARRRRAGGPLSGLRQVK